MQFASISCKMVFNDLWIIAIWTGVWVMSARVRGNVQSISQSASQPPTQHSDIATTARISSCRGMCAYHFLVVGSFLSAGVWVWHSCFVGITHSVWFVYPAPAIGAVTAWNLSRFIFFFLRNKMIIFGCEKLNLCVRFFAGFRIQAEVWFWKLCLFSNLLILER